MTRSVNFYVGRALSDLGKEQSGSDQPFSFMVDIVDVPAQSDLVSCGVFVCIFARSVIRGSVRNLVHSSQEESHSFVP